MNPELRAQFLLYLAHRPRSERGFTLIELLVVLIIIGFLSAIALPSMLAQSNRARESEAKTYLGSINRAQQTYFMEKGQFGLLSDLEVGISSSNNYTYVSIPSGAGMGAYVDTLATPVGTVRGYAGRVWIRVQQDGNATSESFICTGGPTQVPQIIGTVCPP